VPAYSDATRQVLSLALKRLASDPAFSAGSLAALQSLIDAGKFHDLARLVSAIDETPATPSGLRPNVD
jgi:hypothetical protein